jgi:hypothetical protein
MEFGAASKASKAVRDGLGDLLKKLNDNCNNQLTSLFQKVIADTEGEKGTRPVKFIEKRSMLQEFQLGKKRSSALNLKTSLLTENNELVLSWGLKIHSLKSHLPKKSKNSHARFFIVAIRLSELLYNKEQNQYQPKNAVWHGKSEVFYSDYLPVSDEKMELEGIHNLGSPGRSVEGDGIMVCKGLIFYQTNGLEFHPMLVGSCIHIHDVIEIGEILKEMGSSEVAFTTVDNQNCRIERVRQGIVTLVKMNYKKW